MKCPRCKHDVDPHDLLSQTELDVFKAIAQGELHKQIAIRMGLSDRFLSTISMRIRNKTGLARDVDIARYAVKKGLVE